MTSFDFVGDLDLYQMEQELTRLVNKQEMRMVDTNTIALIASKRHFDPIKEQKLIEKSKTTRCKCCHYSGTRPCLYRTCRHFPEQHYGVGLV